jgi:hypothetical protein
MICVKLVRVLLLVPHLLVEMLLMMKEEV